KVLGQLGATDPVPPRPGAGGPDGCPTERHLAVGGRRHRLLYPPRVLAPSGRGRVGGTFPPHQGRRPHRPSRRLLRTPRHPRPRPERGRAAHPLGEGLGQRLPEAVCDTPLVITTP